MNRPETSSTPRPGRVGRIDTAWVRETAATLDQPKYYIVGLPEMVETTLTMLRTELGIGEADREYGVFRGS